MQSPTPAAPPTPKRRLVGLEQRLLARYRALALPPATPIVLGFSGGADSLALAAALAQLADASGPRPLLVHVDHALRDGSAEEQRRAAALANALGLPFRGLRATADAIPAHAGVGPEEAARRERYRLLAAAAREGGAALCALAHHRDDQAETVLLHLLRGAGLGGAAGMAERRDLPIPWWPAPGTEATPLRLWRPLLDEPRAALRAYVAAAGLAPVEDPTNGDRTLRRNALRHDVLPLLEARLPGAAQALTRFARLAAEDDAALEQLAEESLTRAATSDRAVRRADLAAMPTAIRRRAIRRWLRERTGSRSLTADRTDAVDDLIARGVGGRRVEIGEGWEVVLAEGLLHVGRRTDGAEEGRG